MWPSTPETLQLLDQAKGGERAAANALLARHRDSLRRLIELRLDAAVARRVDASDIVQDVLLEASKRLQDYLKNPSMPFHLWLRHIAKDHMIDAHRKHRVAQRRSVDREQPLAASPEHSSMDWAAAFVDPERTPASAAIRKEMERQFADALARMDEDDREVILMRHFEQLSNQDMAVALGLTEPAASMRYLRAVRRLRAELNPA